jgi:hypothetical protein
MHVPMIRMHLHACIRRRDACSACIGTMRMRPIHACTSIDMPACKPVMHVSRRHACK